MQSVGFLEVTSFDDYDQITLFCCVKKINFSSACKKKELFRIYFFCLKSALKVLQFTTKMEISTKFVNI